MYLITLSVYVLNEHALQNIYNADNNGLEFLTSVPYAI